MSREYAVNEDIIVRDRLKIIRKHLGLSQSQFAKAINKTISFLSNVENGRCGMSQDTTKAICIMYGINESWLTYGTRDMFALGCAVAEADKPSVGVRIKEIRKREHLSQEEFGSMIGYCKMQVFAVENKKAIASDKFMRRVSDVFNVGYRWLLTGTGAVKSCEYIEK